VKPANSMHIVKTECYLVTASKLVIAEKPTWAIAACLGINSTGSIAVACTVLSL
jgi:hypothetical protein